MGSRAWSHCRFVPPLIRFISYLLTYSIPLFMKRQGDRTLGGVSAHPPRGSQDGPLHHFPAGRTFAFESQINTLHTIRWGCIQSRVATHGRPGALLRGLGAQADLRPRAEADGRGAAGACVSPPSDCLRPPLFFCRTTLYTIDTEGFEPTLLTLSHDRVFVLKAGFEPVRSICSVLPPYSPPCNARPRKMLGRRESASVRHQASRRPRRLTTANDPIVVADSS